MKNGTPFVFLALNNHSESCGQPPRLTREGNRYYGYFENPFGEQMVFEFDFDEDRGRLWCGDTGWEDPIEVTETECPIILGQQERAWLTVCWEVVAVRRS